MPRMPPTRRLRYRCCSPLLLALLISCVACQAPPVPAGEAQWDGKDVLIERKYVPDKCLRTVISGDFVRYHYHGTLSDGKKFDSSYDRGSTFNVFVGKNQLIAGMEKALLGMCVNERRLVRIPSHLGYGNDGVFSVIPANSVLNFDILLVDVWNSEDQVEIQTYYKPENCTRTIQVSDFVRYHYNGTFLDGTLFDSSYSQNRTYDTYIGKGYVIAGIDEGLLGACVGEKRRIIIPPHVGYGEEGRGNIPGSAVLVFEVHVIDFHNPSDSVAVTTYYKPTNCSVLSKKGDYLKYHYNASLLDGTLLDSTVSLGKTYNIVLGSGQVVLGMDIGLREMCVGEKRRVIIPPHFGYGEAGVEGEVPGSAVLLFDIELLDLVSGLPEGYMFVWHDEVLPNLFEEIDKDNNGEILLEEFNKYIYDQVSSGKGKLAPGYNSETIVKNMFNNQDRNGDGKITSEEFKLKDQEPQGHDEL
ncbi:peptidyl-prolyl cis-trans isomerase FKBP9 isoform X2 [Ahaetulla prasina]|uniref:peptidyl-prolyl cis-trans isomerase FKBP9 isoform X2 n=1 Tax=Ahaetulla prasina TaxID=499056 RepID=UPI0026482C55|nr:peptidyl-prolyl cis-trans isomerase FKBP9 isoform X2 [Ahaetulla prasina]